MIIRIECQIVLRRAKVHIVCDIIYKGYPMWVMTNILLFLWSVSITRNYTSLDISSRKSTFIYSKMIPEIQRLCDILFSCAICPTLFFQVELHLYFRVTISNVLTWLHFYFIVGNFISTGSLHSGQLRQGTS